MWWFEMGVGVLLCAWRWFEGPKITLNLEGVMGEFGEVEVIVIEGSDGDGIQIKGARNAG
jgi:hypothetical protein